MLHEFSDHCEGAKETAGCLERNLLGSQLTQFSNTKIKGGIPSVERFSDIICKEKE